jgi:RimJ/RimL family protein N-acetyltransferase
MLLRPGDDQRDATQARPFGSMLIAERASRSAIGSIGFYGPPDEEGRVTIGYGLVEQYRGRGLGTEALEALIAYCRTRPEVRTILADTEVQNMVSQRVLEKCGFTFIRADDELRFYRLTL